MTNVEEIQNKIAELQKALDEMKRAPKMPNFVALPDRSYKVAQTMVTVAQYRAYCEDTGAEMPEQPEPVRPDNPVTCVSWHDARAYAEWLSNKTGKTCRLPTEDEYEHYCGGHIKGNDEIAVYGQSEIKPVKTKKPNKYGLYDVLGCAWEWTDSRYE